SAHPGGHQIIPDLPDHGAAEQAIRRLVPYRVGCRKARHQLARGLVPEQRPARVAVRAFIGQKLAEAAGFYGCSAYAGVRHRRWYPAERRSEPSVALEETGARRIDDSADKSAGEAAQQEFSRPRARRLWRCPTRRRESMDKDRMIARWE